MTKSIRLTSLLLLASACSDYNLNNGDKISREGDETGTAPDATGDEGGDENIPPCPTISLPAEARALDDICSTEPEGGFQPFAEWTYGSGQGCLSQPIVADLDQDGVPEVIFNLLANFFNPPGYLTVLDGVTGALEWQRTDALMAFGSPPAVGDIDGDGDPDIVIVREIVTGLFFGDGEYTTAAYDAAGVLLWESATFNKFDFNWATAPNIRDMDGDGFAEIIVGRVILNGEDGTTRGRGRYGSGSYGVDGVPGLMVTEGAVPAVTDLDLDGVDEVIVGNAMYDADGNALWFDTSVNDGMISVANLDDDPEGEFIAITYNTIRAVDTDGTILWGPTTITGANILSAAGIADLDQDGSPEIVTAGGNVLTVFHADGSVFWTAPVTDESGATGASFFDFEGDGHMDVVYIDETQMSVFEGETGALKFFDTGHGSNTMMDYPTIADVDADGHAEILVCHNSFGAALTSFGDLTNSWQGARTTWNQHAYDITNINDDLTIPTHATPGFTEHNTWHSAIPADLGASGLDLSAELLDVCMDECALGTVQLTLRLVNTSPESLEDAVNVSIYAEFADGWEAIEVWEYADGVPTGEATATITVEIPAEDIIGATGIEVVVDDDGTGTGAFGECSETNNTSNWVGTVCE